MAPAGSATLTLKAAAVAAILAVMVLPSSARCPSLGPKPVPGPAPAAQCDCSYCGPKCDVSVAQECSKVCGPSSCEDCKADEINKCRASCTGSGSSCGDCDNDANMACGGICYGSTCSDCTRQTSKQCVADCCVAACT